MVEGARIPLRRLNARSAAGRLAAVLVAFGVASAVAGDPPPERPRGDVLKGIGRPSPIPDRKQAFKRVVQMGEARMEAGKHRAAASVFRAHLATHPDSLTAQFGLGRALVNLGRCDEGLGWLEPVRGRVEWTADTSLAEARCVARRGDLDGAEAAYRAVLDAYPQLLLGWYELGQLAIRRGDEPTRITCSAVLAGLDGGERMSEMLDAWAAVAHDDDAAWAALAELRRGLDAEPSPNAEVQAQLIEGLLWLDVDEVDVAVAILSDALASTPKHVRARVFLAEALRRQGAPDLALSHLTDPFVSGPDAPIALPFVARAWVDLGDLARADAALSLYPWRGDAEWTASRAYLAAARGDADLDAWTARWQSLDPPAPRTLAQLRPAGR